MKKAVLNNKIHDFEITFRKRDANFEMGDYHYHPYYEIYYVVSGNCNLLFNHSIHHINQGDFILIAESEIHKFIYDTGYSVERYTLFFSKAYLSEFFSEEISSILQQIFQFPVLHLPLAAQQEACSLLERLLSEATQPDSFSKINCKSYLSLLLSLLGRNTDNALIPNLDSTENAIQAAAQFIFSHFREPITLTDAANVAHMSPSYFSQKFKQLTGFGFKEYLYGLRFKEAENLLLSSSLSVTEIALSCGYNDGNYFGDAFRKKYGLSPLQYRKSK